jgi:3'-5' exoribonuclease
VIRSVEEAQKYLAATVVGLQEPYYKLCKFAIGTYFLGYGGAHHHHAYLGGLAVHTAEVMEHAISMAGPTIDLEVLLTAVCWHDYDKLKEYQLEEGGKIGYTDYIRTIGHVAGSALAFSFHAAGGLPPAKRDAIVHCILSHHGRREWGSPVEPATREAWILHASDMLSSKGAL